MTTTDYLVIGAGPAGLQLGFHLAKARRNFMILEGGSAPGTFFRTFPRHRTLISINKVHTGATDPELKLRMDWNSLLCDDGELLFTRYSKRYFPPADELVRYLGDFADRHRLPIRYDSQVVGITRGGKDTRFRVTDQHGRIYQVRRLIVATGVSRPYIPPIPGIETAELYGNVSIEPRDFLNQRVLILGKGNSAFETADNLITTAAVIHVAGPHSIKMAWRTHYVGHLRAVNNNFLDTYQLKSQNALLDGTVERIERSEDGSYTVTVSFARVNEVKKDMRYDRVIVCTGFKFDASIFAGGCRPKLVHDDRFPEQTAEFESTNVPDLYFAGTLMQARDWKRSTSGFIHGFRYAVRALHHMLERKYEGNAWPHRDVAVDPDALMEAVLGRVNRSSALWQQFAFLCDVIAVPREGGARYCEELPLDYVRKTELGNGESYFTISLEYGPEHDAHDPFDVNVARIAQDETMRSDEGHYLHPVVRHFRRGQLAATHHVTENLENDWTSEATHREPLRAFFARELGKRAMAAREIAGSERAPAAL
jgi:thioredoxin reductase